MACLSSNSLLYCVKFSHSWSLLKYQSDNRLTSQIINLVIVRLNNKTSVNVLSVLLPLGQGSGSDEPQGSKYNIKIF